MMIISKWFSCYCLIGLLVVIATGCKDNTPPASYRLQHQISKVIESQYSPSPLLAGHSTKPAILYQGKTYHYVLGVEKTYRYDLEGRLIYWGQKDIDHPNDPYSKEYNSYTYLGDRIIRYFSNSGSYETLTVNSRGYAIPNVFLQQKIVYEYDNDNYLIRKSTSYDGYNELTTRSVLDGNVRKEVIENKYAISTAEQTYDLTHSALADPLALFREGKANLNLLLESVTNHQCAQTPTCYGISYPYTVSASYTYAFDNLNRVTQQTIVKINTNETTPDLVVNRFMYTN
ncbi:hypothetical protein GCM10028818_22490 [Spirosoma horti]